MTFPSDLPAETLSLLDRYGFTLETFSAQQTRASTGLATADSNRITAQLRAPNPGDVTPLPALGTDSRQRLSEEGLDAVRRGEAGAIILAGGMATRFGGVVKATAPALDDLSFLDIKIKDLEALAERTAQRLRVYLMTSFATDRTLMQYVEKYSHRWVQLQSFPQFISLRLTTDGKLFLDDHGDPSPHATGHGDLTDAIRRAGVLSEFRESGGKYLFVSNVDNLVATLDPAIIGAHITSKQAITVELTSKEPGDKGGAPARVDGHLQIVEAFRFPEQFDQDQISVFNTNTFVLDANAIDQTFEYTWFAVRKKVHGKDVLQFERLIGELTAMLPTQYLRVERHGPDARFAPVKDPDELAQRSEGIRNTLKNRSVL